MIIKTVDGNYIRPPYYIFNEDKLIKDYSVLREAFESLYKRFIVAYSYKSNYVPYMCKLLHAMGAYAEVVSRLEYDLANRILDDPSHIIFNGPVKGYEDLALAFAHNSIVNLDSFYEIDYLQSYCSKNPDREINVGVRVNFAMSKDKGLKFQTGRFGYCLENGDLQKAINRIRNIPSARIMCLHAHFSSRVRSVSIFKDITAKLCQIALESFNGDIKYIDIGGNFGRAPKEMSALKFPSFEDYAQAITGELKKYTNGTFKPYLVIEPGISLVGESYDFVCNVIEVKKVRRKKFIVVDGSVHNVKPTMHTLRLPVKVYDSEGKIKESNRNIYHVVGYTCMETDYLVENFKGPEVKAGDYLVFSNVGAYTIVLNPPFIRPSPPILSRKGNTYHIIRESQSSKDFFSLYRY